MTQPNGVLAAAAEVERYCRRQKWRFCFIGGVAVQRWGEPRFTQPSMSITTCSAEDLVINKVIASRERDWADVESILLRQGRRLDLKLVRKEMPGLLEMTEHRHSHEKFERLVKAVHRRLRK